MRREFLIQVSAAPPATMSDIVFAPMQGLPAAVTSELIETQGPVCVIDDDDWVCDSLVVLLETYGFAVQAYRSGDEFLGDEGRARTKCLIVDQHMPGLDGLSVVAELHRQGIFPPTILITGRLDPGIGRRAGALGVLAILEKPFAAGRLVELIRGAVDA